MKNHVRLILSVFVTAAFFVMTVVFQTFAAGPLVSKPGNKHNLSGLNTAPGITYRAKTLIEDPTNIRGQEICIFCHTPHNANVEGGAPLWNRRFSGETFSRYSSSTLQIRVNTAAKNAAGYDDKSAPPWQPNGSSKLCLSCHDGSDTNDHRLGDVLNGGPIIMSGGNFISSDTAISFASFNPLTNKMKTGHHPVSFVYTDSVVSLINLTGLAYTTYKLPTTFPPGPPEVKLDKQNRMQCTTCHDPHQNWSNDTDFYTSSGNETRKKAPFWVYGGGVSATADQEAVCTACHPMIIPPWQPPN